MAFGWRLRRKSEPKRVELNGSLWDSSTVMQQLSDYYKRMHATSWQKAYQRNLLGNTAPTGVIMHTTGPFSQRCIRWLSVNENAWLRLDGGAIVESADPAYINLGPRPHTERECW